MKPTKALSIFVEADVNLLFPDTLIDVFFQQKKSIGYS